jgi:hypothetical protein
MKSYRYLKGNKIVTWDTFIWSSSSNCVGEIIRRNGSLCINGMRQQTYYELSAAIGVKGKNKQANYSEPVLEFVRIALPGNSRNPKPWPKVDTEIEEAWMSEPVPSEEAAKAVACLFCQLSDASQAP